MCRWGVYLSLVIFATHSVWADDAANPHPLSKAPSPLTDPNAELIDRPLPGAKAGETGDASSSSPSAIGGEAGTLTPFYVRTGIGLSFVTTVDYPDFGISGDVPMQPGFATDYTTILERIDAIDPLKYGKTRNFVDGDVSYLSPYISFSTAFSSKA